MGEEVQALLDKMEALKANQAPAQGQETVALESLLLGGVLYTIESMTANEVTAAVNTAWDNVMNA